MARKRGGGTSVRDIAREHVEQAVRLLYQHPMFAPLMYRARVVRHEGNLCPKEGWIVVTSSGELHVHHTRRAAPEEWVHLLAHGLLHLAFGHLVPRAQAREWNAACDWFVGRFLAGLKLGRRPADMPPVGDFAARDEDRAYQEFCERGIPTHLRALGTAGSQRDDMVIASGGMDAKVRAGWQEAFAAGLAAAVTSAVNVAGGVEPYLGAERTLLTTAQRARAWFISSYPLLGSLAAAFWVVEEPSVCQRLGISVAAVDAELREIYINPAAVLSEAECRFVMAHELLHVGLRHDTRRRGRDPFYWNCAADYVINGWLIEMEVGEPPRMGLLHDPALKGESAESMYDRIVADLRRYRKLATLRGTGQGDMLERGHPEWWNAGDGMDLDDFYRRCLAQGLVYHQEQGRGLLPAGLVEEINALAQPPIPWDVELAHWFDERFPPRETRRSYARPSRRQQATPDVPRPSRVPLEDPGRTYGVVLDTSGSMDRTLLAKALGTIAGYSIARDVPLVRVVFCDAQAYDHGYLPPEEIAGRVKVRGRGGTVLQPGIDLLEGAKDFPEAGPILIITDGWCDAVRVRREHAYLLPEGRNLPFVPRGKVFRMR